jgi:hypothetical protein
MVQQRLKCGATVRKSSRLTDSPLVHLFANLHQYGMDQEEVGTTGELQLRSVNVSNWGAPRAGPSHVTAAGAGTTEWLESDGKEGWDEDDVMLFFMLRSRAARERLVKEVEENAERVQTWREAVTRDPT